METRIKNLVSSMSKTGEFPEFLYKFKPINRYLFDTIINNELWFASSNSFNDPFDCKISFNLDETPDEQVLKYFKNHVYSKLNADSKKYFKNRTISKYELELILNEGSHKSISKIGIASFVPSAEKILMWSHYADSHKGVCLGFDVFEDLAFFNRGGKIDYPEYYPRYDYLSAKNKILEIVVYSKSNEWSYENEYRFIKPAPGNYVFNKNALTEIIFGCEVAKADLNTVCKLVKQFNYPNLKLYTSFIDQRSYTLIINEIN